MPVVNLPAFVGANGMPIGVSLVAPRFRDQHLLYMSKIVGDILMAEGNREDKSSIDSRAE
jgi:Asp-tRNA(Asn)/Glu-tRNA(Gln) amidotransferase A subunit family amidase